MQRQLQHLHHLAHQPDAGEPSLTSIVLEPASPSHRRTRIGRARAWATALIVFSGEGHDLDLAARLRARGFHVTAIDTADGGTSHDVLRNGLGAALEAQVRRGDFDLVFIATPCASYSIAHRPRLRSRHRPTGVEYIPPQWRRYLQKHNSLCDLTARLISAAHEAGAAWALENPSDRGDDTSDAYWAKYAGHAPIFLMPAIRAASARTSASSRTFAQCAFGAKVQKFTTIMHSVNLDTVLGELDHFGCRHGNMAHDHQAHGRDSQGRSLSAEAAAYPPAMNEFLAHAFATWARQAALDRRSSVTAPGTGGLISDGPRLGRDVAEACERARHLPPRFASLRNKRPSQPLELRQQTIPGDLHSPPQPTKPSKRPPRVPPPNDRPAPDWDALTGRLLAGPISIQQLFIGDVYNEEVVSWLELADAAASDAIAGRPQRAVPTRIISQDKLHPWARGIVWDTQNPDACKPVARSTRESIFRGAKQIDRAAIRRIAAALDWHDRDIVDQIGEGGIEVRSQCSLDIVLAFHHLGLRENLAPAAKVVQTDIDEGWVDKPVRHLPFVPCRILPRNVVFQERTRLVASTDGSPPSIELYPKPRVTIDSSHGGTNAVNAGVPDVERFVQLPSVQQHARGLAIVDTASADDSHAYSYVVDAESAYRYCPVQEADLCA